MNELKDWRGTPIEVGSTIVYPGRAASSMWMNEGVVKAIDYRAGYPVGTVFPVLKVVRTDASRGHEDPSVAVLPTTLTVLNRITVVGPRV